MSQSSPVFHSRFLKHFSGLQWCNSSALSSILGSIFHAIHSVCDVFHQGFSLAYWLVHVQHYLSLAFFINSILLIEFYFHIFNGFELKNWISSLYLSRNTFLSSLSYLNVVMIILWKYLSGWSSRSFSLWFFTLKLLILEGLYYLVCFFIYILLFLHWGMCIW